MHNNLVSEQLSIQSIQMGQLEHVSNKLDSSMQMGLMKSGTDNPALQQISMPNIQMGMMEPSSIDAFSQQISISNNQAQLLEPMSNNHSLQKLSVSNMQMGQMERQAYNSQQFLLPNKQLGEMETMLNNMGSQQSSTLNKRKAPMEPTFSHPLSPILSVANKRVAQMEHRPWLQQTSAPNKLPVQMQSISNASGLQRSQAPSNSKRSVPNKTGPHQLSAQKNQTGRMQPPSKVQNESFDSVRSKLRQSLADALALVSQQQDKMSSVGKTSQSDVASALGKRQINFQHSGNTSGASDAVDSVSGEPKESLPTKDDSLAQDWYDGKNLSQETSTNGNAGGSSQTSKNVGQELQPSVSLHDEDVAFSDNFFVKDELLQGNGLAWVLEPDTELAEKKDIETTQNQLDQEDASGDNGEQAVQAPEILASKIEEELFKLFGGVNKKYKEKGRSLLFNLKDRNNPELRERVMAGEIPPERLCSMTAEELASEELSQWRMAKAEELAQMVVLPDSDVDIRRLVKKTHKGEFQVEVEQEDSVSVEVAVGASSLTQMQPKSKEKEVPLPSKPDEMKDKVNATGNKSNSEDQEVPCTLTIPSTEGSDLMHGLMVDDELKDAEFLPPIVSLDEFMESLNSEPPFENLPVDAGKITPISDKDDLQVGSESKSPDITPKDPDDSAPAKPDNIDVTSTKSDADGKSTGSQVKSETAPSVSVPKGEHVWEGVLQLNISAMASVIGIFKSGEKTSAKEWSGCIEIKGRVRLDAFEKFLQELPMSRSRSVMAVHFVCKEGSSESELASFSEVSDSYVLDERVGFGEPAPGVELYLCPPHSKTREMLVKVLPKDQVDALNAIDNGLIGVIVWRKAQITSTISPNSASHHKHNSKKQHFTSRRHHEKDTNANVNITSKHPLPRGGPTTYRNTQPDDDEDDADVPPGFGPPAARDEDDLPEFNFSSAPRPQYSTQNPSRGSGMASFNPHSPTPTRPVDQMRELIHRYGQPRTSASSGNWQDKRGIGATMQPWDDDDDDDDMPEWHPEETQHQRAQTQPAHGHGLQQPMPRAHMVQTVHQPIASLGTSPAMPLQPQLNVIHGQQNVGSSWQQQGTWMVPTTGSHGLPAYQSNGGQMYGTAGLGAAQQGMGWRTDAPKSRGF